MSKRKLGLLVLLCILCISMTMLFVACGTQGEQGEKGEAGKDGISIESVEKVDSEGLTDTYKITYSDGSSTTFTVTNGKDGSDGEDGTSITDVDVNDTGELVIYLDGEPVNLGKIVGENGQDGEDGKDGANGVGIEGATIDENGDLILSLSNDTEINVGKVKGEDGQDGTDGKDGISITGVKIEDGELVITFSDGNSSNLGNIIGADGKDGTDGKDGVGIERIELDEEYNLTIYLTEGEPILLGCIRGEKGENGADGKSAYELYKEKFGYEGTEEQWLIDLANGNLAVVETHTVTFDAQGGSPVPEAQEVKHLGKASKPENPVKDGFLFDGWYYQGEKWSFVGYVVTEDMTLTAQWSEADSGCEITSAEGFEFGTEIIDENEVQTITRKVANATQSFNLAAAISVSDGCTWRLFADYAQSEEIASKMMTDLQTGDNIAWLVVYGESEQALYKVNVYRRHIRNYTFQSEGETHTSGTIEEDHKLNIPETNPTNKQGYTFSHWTVDGERVIFPYMVTVDTIFIAVFTPNSNTLHFDGNGATSGAMDDMTIATDASATLTVNAFERAGYTFKGWATSAGGGVEYADGAQYTMGTESNYTLYAVWEANTNTLHFDKNDEKATGQMDSVQMKTDEVQNLPAVGFEKSGYTFKGWSTSAESEPEYADQATYTMGTESEYTLYAVWEANNNTLHFDGNGATSGTMDDMTIATDASANLTANAFERIGYTFEGWSTSADGEVEYADGAPYIMGTENEYTLYAVWNSIPFTIIYELNGGQNDSRNPSSFTVEDLPLAMQGAMKTECLFMGWYTTEDFSGGKVTEISELNNVTLYAKFLEASNNLTYSKQDGGYAVSGYTGTQSEIFIPDYHLNEPVVAIGMQAFNNYKELESVLFGENSQLTLINDSAFRGCSSIVSIKIPSGVTSIQNSAFRDCGNLTSIGIPSSVTFIGVATFQGCSSLVNIKIPSGVTRINESAFWGCSSLVSIEIPLSVTSVGNWAFYDCNNLETVFYGGTRLGEWAAISIDINNTALTSATRYYYSENEPPVNEDGTAYDGNYWQYVDDVPTIWVKEQ